MSRLTLLLLTLLTLIGGEAAAQESFYRVKQPPASSTGWTYANLGFTFGDTVVLGDQERKFDGSGAPGLVLGVGAYWRTSRIDLGLLFQGFSSFYFSGGVEKEFASGGQFRAAANLRWRYIEDSWGSLYMRLTPGLMAFNHSRKVRAETHVVLGGSTPTDTQIDAVDQYSVGFSLAFGFGLMFYLNDHLGVTVDLDLLSGTSSIASPVGETDYGLFRTFVSAGIEWRM